METPTRRTVLGSGLAALGARRRDSPVSQGDDRRAVDAGDCP
jgi:hypothetical protein